MRNSIFLFLACMLAVTCTREPAPEASLPEQEVSSFKVPAGSVPGFIRIKFKEEPVDTKAESFDLSALGNYTMTRTFPPAGKWEARHRAAGLHLWYDISFDASVPMTKAGEAVSALEGVDIVEFIPEVRPLEVTYPFNDPKLPQQWHYNNPGGKDQWAEGCDVNAFKAWTIETGKPQVIVAVNDIGVDYTHEDLAANIWVNEAEMNGLPGEDDDNNGYADDINGYSFVTYDGKNPVGKIEPGDHGTHVAGTIAAVNNNGIGVCGIAGGDGTPGSGVRIMVTQMMDGRNSGLTPQSFVYAADNGAVLMNCSWGLVNYSSPTPKAYVEAIDYFNANAGLDENGEQTGPMAGGLMIFSAGNDGIEVGHPAMDDNVFAVAALSANYVRSYFTNFGEWIDISAPGGDANRGTYILSTFPNNTYGNAQGSSMAAPHVTGVAALIVSHYGVGRKGFTREKLIYLLQSTANKKALEENGSYATRLGAGLVDAYAALLAEASEEAPAPVTDMKVTPNSNYLEVSWTIPVGPDGETPYAYDVYYSKSSLDSLDPENPAEGVGKARLTGGGKPAGTALSLTLSDLDFSTDYHIRIYSENLHGTFSEPSDELVVRTGDNNKPVIEALDDTSLRLASHALGSMRFRLYDADGHDLKVSVTKDLPGLSSSLAGDILTLNVNALGAEENKTYSGEISLSDGFDTTTSSFSYTILPNNAPAAKGGFDDLLFTSTSEEKTFMLSDYFSDPDGETLNYTVTSSSTSIIVNATVTDGILTVKSNSYGSTTLTVTAEDARGKSASHAFRVLVRDNSRPYDLYPNPVKDYLYIRSGEAKTADLSISNKAGAVVYSQSGAVLDPFAPLAIDLKEQPGGVYYVKIGSDRYTIVKQ